MHIYLQRFRVCSLSTRSQLADASQFTRIITSTDLSGNLASGQSKTIPTPGDTKAPAFRAEYPLLSNVGETTLKISVGLDEVGKVYWVVVPAASGVPTTTAIQGGQSLAGLPASSAGFHPANPV